MRTQSRVATILSSDGPWFLSGSIHWRATRVQAPRLARWPQRQANAARVPCRVPLKSSPPARRWSEVKTAAAFRKDKQTSCEGSECRPESSRRAGESRQYVNQVHTSVGNAARTLPKRRSRAAASSRQAVETSKRVRRLGCDLHVLSRQHARKTRGRSPRWPPREQTSCWPPGCTAQNHDWVRVSLRLAGQRMARG